MSAPTATQWADQITIILHTRNRPEFLRRTLVHLGGQQDFASIAIDVVDGSNDANWPLVQESCRGHSSLGKLTVHHSPADVPFRRRIDEALGRCGTAYVLLASDDDFYLPGWLSEAVDVLERESDIGTVHGHVLFFALSAYEPYGKLERYFIHPRAVPPLSWLENDKASERVWSVNDGTHEGCVPGWYALQRTSQLRKIIEHAERIGLPDAYYEYWMVFYQTALAKTRMLDRIIAARQEDPKAIRRSPTVRQSAEWLATMRDAFVNLLQEQERIERHDAERVVDRYLGGAASELRRLGDRAWLLRFRAHPVGRFLARHLLRRPPLARDTKATHYPDPRLPPIPHVGDDHPAVRIVRGATTNP